MRVSRRRFLELSTSVASVGLMSSTTLSAEGDGVGKSQSLPAPRVVLPTDALGPPQGRPLRIAAITTTYHKYSHADDIITKFIEGYGVVGRIHNPHCRVARLYVEQFPKTDIGRGMAARYGVPLVKRPGEALVGKDGLLDVDGVLLVGEHGDYPLNTKGQKLYPRRRLFEEIVKVFRHSKRSVPVFNDKHLSFSWKNAEWMYRQSRELKFPLMAGSSVPVTWRQPPLAFRQGVQLESAVVVGGGSFESYGFHCLEFLQTFVEKRAGGEVGVRAVQAIEGPAAVAAAKAGKWPVELVASSIAAAPRNRRRPFSMDRIARAIVFRVEYSDGFVAAVCTGPTGLTSEFTFAAKVRGRDKPLGTCAVLPKPQRDHFSFLCNHIEVMFRSKKPSYPVERTLLVTGVLDALHDSRAAGGRRIETPHLEKLAYTPAVDLGSG